MPQITVDYSAPLADTFDRPAFARALHTAVVDIASARPAACMTRFRRAEETVVGADEAGHVLVHVEVALLAGRGEETKARLTDAVVELLRAHVRTTGGAVRHLSAEVRDLDASYRSAEG